jgi:serine/threonine-protein phosphatase 4 regulatory subunit 1
LGHYCSIQCEYLSKRPRLEADGQFPGVCLTLGPDRWPEISGLFQRLQDRAGDRVLTTIASSLHELAKILTPAQVAEDLLPVYTRLIDSKETIRERVFEHIDDFVTGLPAELAWMTFLGLETAWEAGTIGGWRTREAVALHVPAFLALFVERGHDISPILKLTTAALLDKFAAVRDAVIQSIPKSYETLADTNFDAPFRDMLLELAGASSYRQRVTFTRCLREFIKPPPNRLAFEDFFAPALPALRSDVVDVRITLAQIVANLFIVGAYYSDAVSIPPIISQLAMALAKDESADVRDIVRNVDLDRLSKGKELVPHKISPPEQPDRSSGPGGTGSKATEKMRPELDVKSNSADERHMMSRQRLSHSDSDRTPRPHVSENTIPKQRNPFANSFKDALDSPDS